MYKINNSRIKIRLVCAACFNFISSLLQFFIIILNELLIFSSRFVTAHLFFYFHNFKHIQIIIQLPISFLIFIIDFYVTVLFSLFLRL